MTLLRQQHAGHAGHVDAADRGEGGSETHPDVVSCKMTAMNRVCMYVCMYKSNAMYVNVCHVSRTAFCTPTKAMYNA